MSLRYRLVRRAAVVGICVATGLSSVAAETTIADARIAALEQRVARLETRLVQVEQRAAVTRTALENELSQPMLLLVGSQGDCPDAFQRIDTHMIILTRTRNTITGPLLDAAGLTWEDQPGVGPNVYRDFQLCHRPRRTVTLPTE